MLKEEIYPPQLVIILHGIIRGCIAETEHKSYLLI